MAGAISAVSITTSKNYEKETCKTEPGGGFFKKYKLKGELYGETAYIVDEGFRSMKFKTYEERLKDYDLDAVKKWEK